MGANTQNMPPQAPVIILPLTKSGTCLPAQMSKIQPPMKAGTNAIIDHFRPILSISRGTMSVPKAAPIGNTAAIKSVSKMSNAYFSLFRISTHGALQPRPHPNENPPMQAGARERKRFVDRKHDHQDPRYTYRRFVRRCVVTTIL